MTTTSHTDTTIPTITDTSTTGRDPAGRGRWRTRLGWLAVGTGAVASLTLSTAAFGMAPTSPARPGGQVIAEESSFETLYVSCMVGVLGSPDVAEQWVDTCRARAAATITNDPDYVACMTAGAVSPDRAEERADECAAQR